MPVHDNGFHGRFPSVLQLSLSLSLRRSPFFLIKRGGSLRLCVDDSGWNLWNFNNLRSLVPPSRSEAPANLHTSFRDWFSCNQRGINLHQVCDFGNPQKLNWLRRSVGVGCFSHSYVRRSTRHTRADWKFNMYDCKYMRSSRVETTTGEQRRQPKGDIALSAARKDCGTTKTFHLILWYSLLPVGQFPCGGVNYFTVLPGGRNFGQKAQKGQGKNKVTRKNLWPNFGRIYQKWQKRGRRIFSKEVPYLTVLTHFQRQRKTLTSFRIDPLCVCQINRTFSKIGRTFLCTGRKTISGPGNTAISIHCSADCRTVHMLNLSLHWIWWILRYTLEFTKLSSSHYAGGSGHVP